MRASVSSASTGSSAPVGTVSDPAGAVRVPSAPVDPARAIVGFARLLRASGLTVSTDSVLLFARALTAVGWARGDRVYWAARASLCRHPEERARFDDCFRAWFADLPPAPAIGAVADAAILAIDLGLAEDGRIGAAEPDDVGELPVLTLRFSRAEVLAHRDFATYTEAEHEEARRAMARLRVDGALRRSRRLVRTRHAARRPDVRRTVRAALRTDGEPIRRYARQPSRHPRRLVVLCDVSGSMEPYALGDHRIPPVRGRGAPAGGGLHTRNAGHAGHTRVVDAGSRCRDRGGDGARRRLVRWHTAG